MKYPCFFLMVMLFASCRTVVPVRPVEKLESAVSALQESQKESGEQVREIVESTENLESLVPEEIRPEVVKITESVKNLEKQLGKERTIASDISSEVVEVEKKITVLHEEKVKAEIQRDKAIGQRNDAWVILGAIAIIVGLVLLSKFLIR
jgi:uncharacterized protein with von Willebrand factor type A (vWA) domain